MRLDKETRQELLDKNDGFVKETHFKGNHYTEHRRYETSDGELHIRSTGKGGAFGAVGGSQFDDGYVADDDQTKRFLRKYLNDLDTDGIE